LSQHFEVAFSFALFWKSGSGDGERVRIGVAVVAFIVYLVTGSIQM
jgi:hypothetical protein